MELKNWSLNKKIHVLSAIAVFILSFFAYLRSVAPTTSFWDCGEFIACSQILGVMHPPGAPLYLLLGRIMTMLPFVSDPGLKVNLFSVLVSAATVLFTYLVIVKLIKRWRGEAKTWEDRVVIYLSGIFGSLSFAFTDSFWFNAVEAEVYAFSMLFTALVIWLALIWEERSEKSGSILIILFIFYLFSLATGVHLLNILAFPFVFLVAFFHENEKVKRLLLLLAVQIGIPVLLYMLFYQYDPSKIRGYNEMIAYQNKAGSFLTWFGLIWIVITLIYMYNKDKQVFKIWWIIPGLIFIGYSLYLVIYIRANLDPPINENSPKTLQAMGDYLNRKQYGEQSMLLTFLHRKAEFWSYQINFMFNRYFAWQFIGKGTTLDFHNRITEVVSFRGLYGLPFLVGLWGAIHHFFKDKKRAIAVLVLFIMMGYAIIIYLNQPDPQPRERDYSYVGAFFAFALWIGIGFAGFCEAVESFLAEKQKLKKVGFIVCSVVLFVAVPINMYTFNHHSHSRQGNYVAWDYSYNLLQSCGDDAIIFTNGDNDTFPLWYLQEVEGIRRDIKVVNLSLLNTPWYIEQLRDQEPRIPLNMSDQQIENISYVGWETKQFSISINNKVRKEELKKLQEQNENISLSDVPKQMVFTLSPTFPQSQPQVLRIQDIMVLRILEMVNWRRPVYFAVTVARQNLLGLERFLRMDGLAYKVVPFFRRSKIKPEILSRNLLDKFQFRNLNNPEVYYNDDTINLLQNYRSAFIQLAYAYVSDDKKDKAIETLETMSRVIPAKVIPYTHKALALRAADLYRRVEMEPEAEQQLLHFREDVEISEAERAIMRSQTAQGMNDWDKAEKILLDEYKTHPDNMEIISELLRVYELSKQYDKEIKLLTDLLEKYPNAPALEEKLDAIKKLQSRK
ncbi:MAG: DUF2723 domain-containing protein [bacterium]